MEMVAGGQKQPKTDPKLINLQGIVKKGGEDRISALPDSLLLEILSCLDSTEEAIRTGTLSKRWKHVWNFLSVLIFSHDNDNQPWSDFVSSVDKTLTQCCELKLKKFQVYTTRYAGFQSKVNDWIRYAVRCNVEELDLTILDTELEGVEELEPEFLLDQFFFSNSCFTNLTLEGCILNPTGAISWKTLRRLCISNGKLHEDFIEKIPYGSPVLENSSGKLHEDLIEKISSGSPVLETLELVGCYGYRLLNITSKSPKNLVISGYLDPEDFYENPKNILEINAPNILSLTIKGELLLGNLLLLNVSSLVEANLDYYKLGDWETTRRKLKQEILKGLILNLRHVKELKIGVSCSGVLSLLEANGFVFPSNMINNFDSGRYDSDYSAEFGD